MTIDGYRYAHENWDEDATQGESGWRIDSILNGQTDGYGFTDLRALLFLIQRAIKWTEGTEGSETDVHNLRRGFDFTYEVLCAAWLVESADHTREVRSCCKQLRQLTRLHDTSPGGRKCKSCRC